VGEDDFVFKVVVARMKPIGARQGIRLFSIVRDDDEAAFLGLTVERTSLRYAAVLILAGFSAQIAGNFPGC